MKDIKLYSDKGMDSNLQNEIFLVSSTIPYGPYPKRGTIREKAGQGSKILGYLAFLYTFSGNFYSEKQLKTEKKHCMN